MFGFYMIAFVLLAVLAEFCVVYALDIIYRMIKEVRRLKHHGKEK